MRHDGALDRTTKSLRTLMICLLVAGSTLAVFWPVGHFQFLNWDDTNYVSENAQVRGGLTQAGIVWAFTQNYSGNWHPLTWLSHMLDCQLYGLNAGSHHFTNLILHAANAVPLFLLLKRLTTALWRSALVAALFALHPLHVESVAWLAEREARGSEFILHNSQFNLLVLAGRPAVRPRSYGETHARQPRVSSGPA